MADLKEDVMQKSHKILAVCAMLAVTLAALCGCGGTQQQQATSYLALTDWQTVADTDGLELILDEVQNGCIVQVPQFANVDDNAELAAINARLQAKANEYKLADGMTSELVPLVMDTDSYLSVVLYEAEEPAYGTDGAATAYVWNKITKGEVDEALAWSMGGGGDDNLDKALKEYCTNELAADGVEYKWVSYEPAAYFVDSDSQTVLIINALIKTANGEADPWHYLLKYKGGHITGRLTDDFKTK